MFSSSISRSRTHANKNRPHRSSFVGNLLGVPCSKFCLVDLKSPSVATYTANQVSPKANPTTMSLLVWVPR